MYYYKNHAQCASAIPCANQGDEVDVMNEIEVRYKSIRGLLSLADSEKELSRGCFAGIDDDLVSFAGRGLDEAVDVFRKTVDDYLVSHTTADVLLRTITPHDPTGDGEEAKVRRGFGALWEPDEMERDESVDGLLRKVERLGFLISKRLEGRDPGTIVESIEGALAHGVKRACKETEQTPWKGRRKSQETERPGCQRRGSGPRAAALS
jgi:hypothetical protein